MAANAEVIRGFDKEVCVTVFPDAFASSKAEHVLRWSRLVQNLSAPKKSRGSKAECELLKLATFGDIRTTKNSLRHDANMTSVTGLVGDYDGEAVSIQEAGARLREHGVEAFLYTSASHKAEKPRWRVLAPLSAIAEPGDHYSLMASLNAALGGILSAESFTASQTYYFGRVEGAAYETLHVEGSLCIDELHVEGTGPAKRERNRVQRQVDDLDEAIVYASVTEETISDLKSALSHLASMGWADNGNRVKWIKIGHNLAGLGEIGEELFVEMSALGDAPDPEATVRDRFSTFRGDRSDYRAIFAAAQAEGWSNPKSKKEEHKPRADGSENPFAVHEWTSYKQNYLSTPWIIKGVLPQAEVGILYGQSGSGKTFFVLDMAACIARGAEWRGRKVSNCRVVYVAAEAREGIKKRMDAYDQHVCADGARPDIIASAPNLLSTDTKQLIEAIGSAGLIILDTMAASHSGDENSAKDMGLFLAACKDISHATGAMVLAVHHTGKEDSKGMRGSSALFAGADFVMEIFKNKVGDRFEHGAMLSKSRDDLTGTSFGFELKRVTVGVDDEGDDVTTCVIEPVQKEVSKTPKRPRKLANLEDSRYDMHREILTIFERITDESPTKVVTDDALLDAIVKKFPSKLRRNMVPLVLRLEEFGVIRRTEDGLSLADDDLDAC